MLRIKYKNTSRPKYHLLHDPLRMLRAIRFNQLSFEIENSSLGIHHGNAERIKIISGERIVDELNKIFQQTNLRVLIII
jgi:tRNA nucleotidyltransferase/poly(A) polymerase